MTAGSGPYTLVVTTYDRPALLSRLLDYLERERADFPVLVLDSSPDEACKRNADRIGRSPIPVRHVVSPPDLHPYLKVQDGVGLVTTPYCSICADDDLVILPAVRQCVGVLERQADVAAAHGWYFNFAEADHFDLSYIVYRGPSLLAADPLLRLREMFAAYEAVFYAVYRTPVLQAVFRRVHELQTVLARELLTAALTAVAGRIVRIDDFYYGRSTGESLLYENWHPHQILAKSPELLVRDYRGFREVVLADLAGRTGGATPADRAGTILDLIFLRYLAPFLRADLVDLIINDHLAGSRPEAVVEHLWDVFVRSVRAVHPLKPLMAPNGSGFAPQHVKENDHHADFFLVSRTARGVPRTYMVFWEFLFPDLKPPLVVDKPKLLGLVDRLNAY